RQRDPARDGGRPERRAGLLAAGAQYRRLDARAGGGLAMTRRRKQREFDTMNLSFLDAVSCGFGAIILLLVITKLFEPIRLEETQTDLDRLMVRYQQELEDILGETEIVRREQASLVDEVELEEVQIAQLQRQLTRIRAEMLDRQDDAEVANELAGRLAQAQ